MSKIVKKIKDRSGESIGETLVALLISALALVMLAGAITAASGIIKKSTDKLDLYYRNNEALAMMDYSDGPVQVTLSGSSPTLSDSVNVYYGTNSEISVVAFKYKKPAGSGG